MKCGRWMLQGFPIPRPGDWNWGDWGTDVDLEVLTTCWYYLALKAEKEFALYLYKQNDANRVDEMMKRIAAAFDNRYWTGTAYRSRSYKGETDDRSQAMAVVSGLAPVGKYKALLKVFKKEYHASPYMEKYIMEALFVMGEPNFALERMRSRYTKMMAYPYTTLFEGWGIGAEGFGVVLQSSVERWSVDYIESKVMRNRTSEAWLQAFSGSSAAWYVKRGIGSGTYSLRRYTGRYKETRPYREYTCNRSSGYYCCSGIACWQRKGTSTGKLYPPVNREEKT